MTAYYHVLLRPPVRKAGGFALSTNSDLAWEDSQSSGSTIEWFADRPITGKIVSVTVISKGQGHTAVPASPSRIDLYRYDPMTAAATTVAYDTDDATTATIDSMHSWGITSLTTETISDARFYAVKITGESGTNSQNDHVYHNVTIGVDPV